ncbi:MAG: acyclic terpene utilization AtuA family protein [Candidatus Hydrogenedens sp.]|nr:acyclic terpene utilization AtuA family protein [Candidatus Hydrogenedens sp.]
MITIGNAQGFWGDSPDAPARLVEQYPALDYLTLDYLAEVSLSIMALQRSRDPQAGYARDFIGVVKSLVPQWQAGAKVRIVCNAGGLNPAACAAAVRAALAEAGLPDKSVALISGDDVLPLLQADPTNGDYRNWESGEPLETVADRLNTANAYIGAEHVAEALALGADIVVTGRVADPSLTLGIGMHEFGWSATDYNLLAAGTVAGHLLECGTQVCGGISTDWLELPDPDDIGFPIVELEADGSIVVTKPQGTGGAVTEATVKEQLLYEIGDPVNYLSPDCRVDFTALRVAEESPNRVRVDQARGSEPTDTYKVSATYRDGFWAQGLLTIAGRDAIRKAKLTGEIILKKLERAGYVYDRSNIECLGAGAVAPGVLPVPELFETVLRLSVADQRKEAVDRFAREIAPMVTSGAQGTTGYAAGRPKPSPVFAYWPCLIKKDRVNVTVALTE